MCLCVRQSATALERITLEKNKLGDRGTKILAPALLHCPSLHTVVLRQNGISTGGATAIGNMLASGYDRAPMAVAMCMDWCSSRPGIAAGTLRLYLRIILNTTTKLLVLWRQQT